ncbi:MAG: hypothetical protein RIR31_841, partial [Bacteroidota bacterium]
MKIINHCAIDIAGDCNYQLVVDQLMDGYLLEKYINLSGLSGQLYSHITINKLIAEEMLHDKFEIITPSSSNLKCMSSGEQKKALLQYLIAKNPDFIVVDNVLDNLDTAAQAAITTVLQQIAKHTLIVQVINRKKDILSFIENVFIIKNNAVLKKQNLAAYLNEFTAATVNRFPQNIPAALHIYNLPKGPLLHLNQVSVSYDGRP